MEKRQLDLNAPLLSVRRHFPSRPNNQEVSTAGAVPFHWERTPGTPKHPSLTPMLTPSTQSLAAPPRFRSGENTTQHQFSQTLLMEKLNDCLNCKDESGSEFGDESKYNDDAYSDDMLSFTESLSLNCSLSNISENHSSGLNPSEALSIDKQTRDYIMGRFLPAAKAAVLETSEYVPRKPPKDVARKVSVETRPSVIGQFSPYTSPYHRHYIDKVDNINEEQDFHFPAAKKQGKTWGIFNRLRLNKRSPSPLAGPRSRMPSSPTRPPIGDVAIRNRSGPLDKNIFQVQQNKKKSHSGLLSQEQPGKEDTARNEFPNNLDSIKPGGMSPLRRYRSGMTSPHHHESPKPRGVGFLSAPKNRVGTASLYRNQCEEGFCGVPKDLEKRYGSISPYRNQYPKPPCYGDKYSGVPKSPYRNEPTMSPIRGAGFLGVPKMTTSSGKLFNRMNERETSGEISDPLEKTVYIDSGNKTDVGTRASREINFCAAEKLKVLEGNKGTGDEIKSEERLDQQPCKIGYFDDGVDESLDRGFRTPECISEAKLKGYKKEDETVCRSTVPTPFPNSPTASWLWNKLSATNSQSRERKP